MRHFAVEFEVTDMQETDWIREERNQAEEEEEEEDQRESAGKTLTLRSRRPATQWANWV